MSIHLVTGHAGKAHIKAANHGAYNAAVVGKGQYVLDFGTMFEASVLSANKIRIYDGILLNQGRQIQIDPNTYEEVDIENGAQGYMRNDIIAMRYSKNAETDVESASLVVIKGTPSETNPIDPECVSGDIINGAVISDMPLYKVPLDGLTVGDLEPMFESIPSLTGLDAKKQNNVTGAASTITDNNLAKNRVMVTDGNGKAAASNITTTLLGYLSGATGNIQTQLNSTLTTAQQAFSNAGLAQSTAHTATSTAATAKQTADTLAGYLQFITDMQTKSTILAWATTNKGITVGMMVTPYAPADGPQMKVTTIAEWNILILAQPGQTRRQTVLAFSYGGGVTTVLKRCLFDGAWLSDWVFVQN